MSGLKIGFDVSQTGSAKAGCGYFADSLIRQLAAEDSENQYILYPAVGDLYWDPGCAHRTFSASQPNFRRLPAPTTFEASRNFWSAPGPDFEERLGSPDIVHANNFYCPSGLRKARLVYTLYDLSFLSHPEWTTEANRIGCAQSTFKASLHADWILAISEFTRNDFLATYPHYSADRVTVVYLGSRFDGLSPALRPARFHGLERGRFWLSVGTIEPRKNHKRLIEAYARLRSVHGDAGPLVLTGGKGWLMDEFEGALETLGLRDCVIPAGYVQDSELQWLYENCMALVYPSLFEGFGLPVLEAMSLGAPVICSNTTSLPEVVGDAGVLVDPDETGSIFEAMLRISQGAISRDVLRDRGRERAARFSWSASAHQVLDVYRKVAAIGPAAEIALEARG